MLGQDVSHFNVADLRQSLCPYNSLCAPGYLCLTYIPTSLTHPYFFKKISQRSYRDTTIAVFVREKYVTLTIFIKGHHVEID